jgi:hypothetical protein
VAAVARSHEHLGPLTKSRGWETKPPDPKHSRPAESSSAKPAVDALDRSDTHAQGRGNLAETKPLLLEGGLDGPFGFSGMGGRPSVLPFALALASPARTRSWIIARSNSANTPSI